ncbi:MAG: TolC family protein [Verrucomicrobia bacterium]|nr:TolC family protein [Verrucomicrobiota bacterium]
MKLTSSLPWPRQFAVAALAVILTVPGAWAQESTTNAPPGASHTLDALVVEALEKNPELKFYDAEITAAKAGRKTAGLFANPEVSGGVGQKRVTGGGLSAEGVAWSVSVVQPFEWPGRIGLRKAIANHDIELAHLGYERFKIALAGRVRTLAYGLFAAQEKSTAATEVAERFKALREVLVQRDPAGLTPLLETRVIEATELNAQRKASEAMLATQAALLELNQLRGVAPDTRLAISQANLSFRPPPQDRSALITLARTNNFELRVRAVELAQQGFRVDLAKNERYPSISVGPTYSQENAGNDRERILGVGLSLPLPLWNRNKGNIESAVARQMQAEVSLNVTEREIQRKVIEAALTYETKLREMAKWRPDSVQHFKEAAEVADRHYRLGAVPISTYVELQKQYLDAVEGLLDTKKEALDSAAQLELLTGLPLPLSQITPTEEKK